MNGRRMMPTALREATGTRAHKKRNRSEPKFQAADASRDRPKWLSGPACEEWDRVAPQLVAIGLLPDIAVPFLAAYCQCFGRWLELDKRITKDGYTVTLRDDKGVVRSVVKNPDVAMCDGFLRQMRQLGAEFGLTPSAAGRLQLDEIPVKSLNGQTIREEIAQLEAELEGELGEAEAPSRARTATAAN